MSHRNQVAWIILAFVLLSPSLSLSCVPFVHAASKYSTRNVFLIVMDGVHYSETFGDAAHRFIPHLWNDLRPLGTLYTDFRNNNITVTVPGHTAMLTGVWQNVKNDGTERPHQPTVFEYLRKEMGVPRSKTWIVVQHMNLISTDYSDYPGYGELYRANLDSPGLHKRDELKHVEDVATWDLLKEVMNRDHPSLVMVNFGMTDSMGHDGGWSGYTNAIRDADELIFYLWLKIQGDPVYADKTTVIITNDHGRHLDGVKTGFQDHGDDCEGCRHVMMLVIGPDMRANVIVDAPHESIDVAPTIGELMGFRTPLARGKIMSEMLIGNQSSPIDNMVLIYTGAAITGILIVVAFTARRAARKSS